MLQKVTRIQWNRVSLRGSLGFLALTLVLFVALPVFVSAQFASELERVDEIIDAEDPEAAMRALEALEGDAESGTERAEVYWRMASATLMRGDQAKDGGAGEEELLSIFERGEEYGRQAIDEDPSNPLGYYWKSANIGRWGQTKGILNSLFRAPDMRDLLTEAVTRDPEHADSYYVLGQLYAKVPSVVSFGNVEYAVSLGRLSVDLMEEEVRRGDRDELVESFYVQLASHLIDRDWNRRKRERNVPEFANDYRNATSPIERGFYYEGTVSIPRADDADEAEEILDGVIGRLERISSPTPSERRQLEEARELKNGL